MSITGTGDVSANKNENYLVLSSGTCTLHFRLTNPAGNSVLTYKYSGNKISDVKFEKDFIYMNQDGNVVIKLDYGNGYYNIFTYTKE